MARRSADSLNQQTGKEATDGAQVCRFFESADKIGETQRRILQ